MPHIKNALLRYRIIDKCLKNEQRPYPTKEDMRFACEESLYGSTLGEHICDSTIEKDMYAMRMEMDAPIKYSKRYGGYYYSDENFSINEIPLSQDDIQSIKFAASTLAQFKDADIFKQFGFALDKIIDRVSAVEDTKKPAVENKVQFETGVRNVGSDYLTPLLTAIEQKKVVYFSYQSFVSGDKKHRKVTPLLLKEYRNRWYTITFDMVKSAIITYALDRITDFETSDEDGLVPVNFNPDTYFKHAVGITANENDRPETITFKASNVAAKYIDSQPLHASQEKVKEGKKRTTFQIFANISEELIRELLSYSDGVEIVSPDALRDEVIGRLNASLELYK
jgi:predicted DNA-binding transcriptional regulator YafY